MLKTSYKPGDLIFDNVMNCHYVLVILSKIEYDDDQLCDHHHHIVYAPQCYETVTNWYWVTGDKNVTVLELNEL
jgi:hypothetical protein